ncbi:MAG: response regulator [Calothrix sp. FI2-JRJ7]|jgi:PAS domain S-box-containing protein|nr:response regulator [Calothrix sp. FI2-JRJ7]
MRAEESRAIAENLFVGGGELGALLRAHNWSQTTLGAVETWSDDLKMAVQTLLTELDKAKPPEKTKLDSKERQNGSAEAVLHQANQLNAFRVKLADALRPLTDASEIQAVAARVLGESLGATRVIYIEVVSGGEEVIVHCNYTNGVAQLSGRYRLEDYRRNLTADHEIGRTQVVTDIPNNPKYTVTEKAKYREIDIAAHIDVPLIKNNQFVALLAVHQSTPRQWTKTEVKLVEETAERTWADVERARIEGALRESEQRFRLMADAVPQIIWITDAQGRVEFFNKQWSNYTGVPYEPTTAAEVAASFVHPLDGDLTMAAFNEARRSGGIFLVEHRIRSMKGTYRWFLVRGEPYRDPQTGEIVRWFGASVDIHNRKTAEQEREQLLACEQAAREIAENANRIKDEFLAVLSHELRSPLNPILGWTRLLQKGKLDAARQREALATIERNAKLQTQLIEDLLDTSRIMQGKLSLTVAPVSLTFVISAAVETVRLAAEAKNIQIILDFAPAVAPVSGDAARLQQVVWNLLTNAVKFTPNHGQVTVELRQFDKKAQIRVIDTGKGINPQFLPYVFEYFRQEDGSTTRKFGGLGLGLAIVRQIVEMHGGTVQAESQGEGQGATFIVQLPTMQQTWQEAPQPIQTQTDAGLPLAGIQILLVDDEPDTREFQAFLLSQSGAKVTVVASGLEALQSLEQSIPDVLVSDIGMPQMDGYMLLQQIRSRPPNQGGMIPAIALTAYAGEMDQQRALQAGFQTYITKPVEPEKLVRAIVDRNRY